MFGEFCLFLFPIRQRRLQAFQAARRRFPLGLQSRQQFTLLFQGGLQAADVFQDPGLLLALSGQFRKLRFQFLQMRVPLRTFVQLRLDLAQSAVKLADRFLLVAPTDSRRFTVGLPDFQPEDVAEDLLPVPRPGDGELVRLALQKNEALVKVS